MKKPCPVCANTATPGVLIEYAPGADSLASRCCAVITEIGEPVNGCGAVYLRLGDTWGRWTAEVTPEALRAPSVRFLVPSPEHAA